jgi:RNA polymerase sigma factor (TIGR02999 family)
MQRVSSSSPYTPAVSSSAPPSVTELLIAWSDGDHDALVALLPIVYGELHRQATRALRREAQGHTLRPTELVNEAYLKLVEQNRIRWSNRAQFFGVAAQIIRRILVDHERDRRALKRGGGGRCLTLERFDAATPDASDAGVDVLALHEALERLAAIDPEQVRLIELRYFAGLSIDETAAALETSASTVKREWTVARAWLRRELGSA